MPKSQEEFFQEHAVDGVLSDEKMAEMLTLPANGDTGPAPGPEDGTAGPAPSPSPSPAPAGDGTSKVDEGTEGAPKPKEDDAVDESTLNASNAVIKAKDGVHTIGFEKLEEAREAKRKSDEALAEKTREADELRQQLATATAAAPPPSTSPAPAPAVDTDGKDKPAVLEGVDFGDYSDAAIAKAVVQLTDKRVAQAMAETAQANATRSQQDAAKNAAQAHYNAIYTAHPDADSVAQSKELEAWIASKPKFEQSGIRAALAQGATQDVIDLFTTFKEATGKTGAATDAPGAKTPTAEETAAAAAKAIADAKTKPIKSLTELPAGTTAHIDEADAMLAKSATQLMQTFEGKDPKAIMDQLNRVL